MTLEEVKSYLRVTYDDDDSYIDRLISIADGYLEDGITNYKERAKKKKFREKAEMVQLTIIQALYDERYMLGQKHEMNYIVRSMIHQLEYGD